MLGTIFGNLHGLIPSTLTTPLCSRDYNDHFWFLDEKMKLKEKNENEAAQADTGSKWQRQDLKFSPPAPEPTFAQMEEGALWTHFVRPVSRQWQLCGLGRWKEGEGGRGADVGRLLFARGLAQKRDGVRAGREHRSGRSCFVLNEQVWITWTWSILFTLHSRTARRKMRGLEEKTGRLLPALILRFHNSEILSQCSQMEDFTQ